MKDIWRDRAQVSTFENKKIFFGFTLPPKNERNKARIRIKILGESISFVIDNYLNYLDQHPFYFLPEEISDHFKIDDWFEYEAEFID